MKQLVSFLTIVTLLGGQLLPLLPATGAANPLISAAQAEPLTPPLATEREAPPQSPTIEYAAQAPTPTPTPMPPPPPPPEPDAPDRGIPEEISGVPGVTDDWWAAVQEQIRSDMYGLAPDKAAGGDQAYRGHNPAHNLDLAFSAGGLQLGPAPPPPDPMDQPPDPSTLTAAAEAGPDWQWNLRFSGYGYQGRLEPVPAPIQTSQTGNRLEYQHAGLTEWYLNDERGLEQGFTLDAPPAAGTG